MNAISLIAWGCALLVAGLTLHTYSLPTAIAAAGVTLALFGAGILYRAHNLALETTSGRAGDEAS